MAAWWRGEAARQDHFLAGRERSNQGLPSRLVTVAPALSAMSP